MPREDTEIDRIKLRTGDPVGEELDEAQALSGNLAAHERLADPSHPAETENKTGARQDQLLGTILDDKFEIVSLLGGGGVGQVYKANHLFLKKTVAIKLLFPHVALDQNKVERFKQEALALSCLEHPNIINVLDYGQSDKGQPYLVMEYLDGVSLADVISTEGPLPPERAIPLLLAVCDAMTHAHLKGLIHRDLKPSNIMLVRGQGGKETVKLIDFGLAKQFTEGEEGFLRLTQTGEIFGSPYYMSPEQVKGQRADIRTDIYAMGILMFEALTGKVPFSSKDPVEVFSAQLNDSPGRLTGFVTNSQTRDCLELIILKAMAKNPEERYQTMGELAQDLSFVGQSPRGLAHSGTQWKLFSLRLKNYLSRSLKPEWVVGIALLLLAQVATVFFLTHNNAARDSGNKPAEPPVTRAATEGTKTGAKEDKTNGLSVLELDRLGQGCVSNGKLEEGIPYFRKEIELLRRDKEDEGAQMATALHYLAYCLGNTGKHGEAEKLGLQALELRRKLEINGPILTTTLEVVAGNYLSGGMAAKAEPFYRQALESEEKSPRENKTYAAIDSYYIGVCLQQEGKSRDAERFFRKALKYHQAVPGHKNTLILITTALANNLAAQGKDKESSALLKRVEQLQK